MRISLIWRGALALILAGALFIIALNLIPQRRVVQNPIPHSFSVTDREFPRVMGALFDDHVTRGHHIDTLINGDQIFPAMLDSIRNARDSVNFLTYIYWSGDIARQFAEALAAKAAEGVEVRVLLDWAGSIPFDEDLVKMMEGKGVKVHRFRPLKWYSLDRVNNRTHRKLLIVDGILGFTGGVGIGDQWKGDARNPDEWRDTHYRVEGPVVSKMQAAFAENWLEATNEVLQAGRFYPEQASAGELYAQHVTSSPTGGSQAMHQMMLMAIAAAQRHVRIGMGYFAPDEIMIIQLLDARRRGVEIDVLVPGEQIDVSLVRHASRHQWGRLLAAGVRIYEFVPTNYHTKVVIVDEQWTTIGSSNFDERSFRLNDEANLNVYNREFALRQIEDFTHDLSRSREISFRLWQRRSMTEKIKDWAANLLRTQL
jgi:cardiolipin synthase